MDPSVRLVHRQWVKSVEAEGAYMPPSARRWTETNELPVELPLPQGANNESGRKRCRERGRSGCGTRKVSEAAMWRGVDVDLFIFFFPMVSPQRPR